MKKRSIRYTPGRTDNFNTEDNNSPDLSSNVKNIMISGTSIRDGLIAELNKENRINQINLLTTCKPKI